MYLYVTVLSGCIHAEVPAVAAGPPPPSFTLLVCAVLLQPGAEHSCPVRPAANISGYLGAAPLYANLRPLFLDKKRESRQEGELVRLRFNVCGTSRWSN